MKAQIEFKSVLDGLTVKQKNEAFHELTDEGKRLEIAWDALKLVSQNKVEASYGSYWSNDLKEVEGTSKELQKVFNSNSFFKQNDCKVCQRGLMMLSQIRLGNNISSDHGCRDEGEGDLIQGFSMDDFQDMEAEFESNYFDHPYYNNTDEKLANICCNILVNGNFNTEDTNDYLK